MIDKLDKEIVLQAIRAAQAEHDRLSKDLKNLQDIKDRVEKLKIFIDYGNYLLREIEERPPPDASWFPLYINSKKFIDYYLV